MLGGGQRLCPQDVIKHAVEVMMDDFSRSLFGRDVTCLLKEEVLCVRKYHCQLSSDLWNGFASS